MKTMEIETSEYKALVEKSVRIEMAKTLYEAISYVSTKDIMKVLGVEIEEEIEA